MNSYRKNPLAWPDHTVFEEKKTCRTYADAWQEPETNSPRSDMLSTWTWLNMPNNIQRLWSLLSIAHNGLLRTRVRSRPAGSCSRGGNPFGAGGFLGQTACKFQTLDDIGMIWVYIYTMIYNDYIWFICCNYTTCSQSQANKHGFLGVRKVGGSSPYQEESVLVSMVHWSRLSGCWGSYTLCLLNFTPLAGEGRFLGESPLLEGIAWHWPPAVGYQACHVQWHSNWASIKIHEIK